MDIVGIPGIQAEAELLAAVVHFFESVGLTSKDVGLKVNSRKVLGAVLKNAGVPDKRFAETCVIIDKLDKIGAEEVKKELKEAVQLPEATCDTIIAATGAKTLDEFAALASVGEGEEVKELRTLFDLAADYGYADWLQFDASIVRGLAYYTLYGSPKEVPCCGSGPGRQHGGVIGRPPVRRWLQALCPRPRAPRRVAAVRRSAKDSSNGPLVRPHGVLPRERARVLEVSK